MIALALISTGISIPAAAASAHRVIIAVTIPVLVATAAVFVGVRSWRVSLALTGESVLVQNLLRTYRIPLADVVRAWAGTYGVWITTRDGRRICASAVAKSNFEAVTGRCSSADDVAQAIAEAAGRAGAAASAALPVPASRRHMAVQAAIGVALLVAYAVMDLSGTTSGTARPFADVLGLAGLSLVAIPALDWYQRFTQRSR